MKLHHLILFPLSIGLLAALETSGTKEEVQPSVTRIEDGRLELRNIVFDPTTRAIEFPAEVNMTEGLLEFLIVHQQGKVHESLLSTKISPEDLNVVFKLLRYPASRELYLKQEPDGTLANEFETATEEEKIGARLMIYVKRHVDDEERIVSLNRWITHAVTEKPMPGEPWVYGGSFTASDTFVAEASGDIAAIFLSNAALINYSGEDHELDEVWLPHPTRVPAVGTEVTVIIKPFETVATP